MLGLLARRAPQQRDRRRAVRRRAHRQVPRQLHPRQARRGEPHPGRGPRPRAGAGAALTCTIVQPSPRPPCRDRSGPPLDVAGFAFPDLPYGPRRRRGRPTGPTRRGRMRRAALITGGSRGLGATLAAFLAGQDYDLLLTGRDAEALRGAAASLAHTAAGWRPSPATWPTRPTGAKWRGGGSAGPAGPAGQQRVRPRAHALPPLAAYPRGRAARGAGDQPSRPRWRWSRRCSRCWSAVGDWWSTVQRRGRGRLSRAGAATGPARRRWTWCP